MKLKRQEVEDIVALTALQKGLLFHFLMDPSSDAYFEQLRISLVGRIGVSAFEAAWDHVVRTNEMLRTVFRWKNLKEPVQVVLKRHRPRMSYSDVSQEHDAAKNELLVGIGEDDRREKFTLTEVPFRVTLCKTGDNSSELFMSNHHILYDGWSNGVILREFLAAYNDILAARDPTVYRKARFRDYIVWLAKKGGTAERTFWKSYLFGVEPSFGHGVATLREQEVATERTGRALLAATHRDELRRFCGEKGLTIAGFLLGVVGYLLMKANNARDGVIGIVMSGRPHELLGVENTVGMFINTVPMRLRLEDDDTVIDYLRNVQRDLERIREFQYTPLVDTKRYGDAEKPDRLFDTIIAIENYPLPTDIGRGDWGLRAESYSVHETTSYPLSIGVECRDEVSIDWHFVGCESKMKPIVDAIGQFERVAERFMYDPSRRACSVEIVSNEERRRVRDNHGFQATFSANMQTVHEQFEEQVRKTPDNIAVVCRGRHLTYGTLNRMADRVCERLRATVRERTETVCLVMDRSPEMVASILGTMKAGAAYVPISPSYPKQRIRYIIRDAVAAAVITMERYSSALDFAENRLTLNQEFWSENTGENESVLAGADWGGGRSGRTGSEATALSKEDFANNPAYVIYTSGTTGKPKGVVVEHGSVLNLLAWFRNEYKIDDNTRLLSLSGYEFDASVEDIFATLTSGGRLYIGEQTMLSDVEYTRKYVDENRIDVIDHVPSYLNRLLDSERRLETVRVVISGGENLKEAIKARIMRADYPLYNHYGPTECTVDALSARCTTDREDIIGTPVRNVGAFLLDVAGTLTPPGAAGELCISGACLARGYLNQPELTHRKFQRVFSGDVRIFRTGDLASAREDGSFVFLGRKDEQVKVNGVRIELGEIESVLACHSDIEDGAVVANTGGPAGTFLEAFYVSEKKLQPETVRHHLSRNLPAAMVPAVLVQVECFPTKHNGKVDKLALSTLIATQHDSEQAPRTQVERRLAAIWADILDIEPERIGLDSNFFGLGGHSLNMTTLVSRITREFGEPVELSEIFGHPTIRRMARVIETYGWLVDGDGPEVNAMKKVIL